MRKEIECYHALGFAVLLLKEKSKAPLHGGWTRGERQSLEELKKGYRPGLNIGVRLGKASFIGGTLSDLYKSGNYLAAIDCDVKSKDGKDLTAMKEKLKELFGDSIESAPRVASGRGGGSAHYYIVTETPAEPMRLATSFNQVKVHMPSVKPSNSDLQRLTSAEIKAGLRMRNAWEICLMGEGQQCVLPPSIHPDTGKNYVWSIPLNGENLPIIEIGNLTPAVGSKKKSAVSKDSGFDFRIEKVDLTFSGLPKKVISMIEDGNDSLDRSADLFSAMLSMQGAGMTTNQILNVLSDPKNFLGQVAYDHTKSNDRKTAVNWLYRQNFLKARRAILQVDKYDVEELPPLSKAESEKQELEINNGVSWRTKIKRVGGKPEREPKCTFENIKLILGRGIEQPCFKFDQFAKRVSYGANTPWGGIAGDEIKDIDLIKIKDWLCSRWQFEPHCNLILEVVLCLAHKNSFHPVKDYLFGLPDWDQVPRAETWLQKYLNATGPQRYLRAVSRKTLVAMIARILKPGCKFDCMPVLIGEQGVRKSTTVLKLAEPWGSDAKVSINDKDGVINMFGKWVMEFGEMESLRKAEVEAIKEFLVRGTDRLRLPFGKLSEEFPRQCIFIGTTNKDEFLKDETGNRRFWPVSVGECDPEGLMEVRDQLFAEAMVYYQMGEILDLSKAEMQEAKEEHEKRMVTDILEERIDEFLAKKTDGFNARKFTLNELFKFGQNELNLKDDLVTQRRIGFCLRRIGYSKKSLKNGSGGNSKYWVRGKSPENDENLG